MGRIAPDQSSEADDAVHLFRPGQLLNQEGDLERSRDLVDGDVRFGGTQPGQGVQRPFEQPFGDEIVEPADYDADLESFGLKFTLECLHMSPLLSAAKVRLSFLQESLRSFLEVLGRAGAAENLRFELQTLIQSFVQAVVYRL